MDDASNCYTQEEKEIALILLQLRNTKSLLPNWGRKRKRSAIADPISVPLHFTPTPSRHEAVPVATPSCDAQTLTAPSPATPLSLSPTQSEEKLNNLRRKPSLRKRKEVYVKNIKDLTESIALLNQEVDNVKGYCDKLKVYNLKLKARKEELTNGSKRENKNCNLEFSGSMQSDYVNASVNSSNSTGQNEQRNQSESQLKLELRLPIPNPRYNPIMLNQNHMSAPFQILNGDCVVKKVVSDNPTTSLQMASSSSSGALGHVNSNNGPLIIPDLNFTPEEFTQVDHYQPLDAKDLSRAMAAHARKRRLQISRLKNPIRADRPICSYR